MAALKAKREETRAARREAGVEGDDVSESDEEGEVGPQSAGEGDAFAKVEATSQPKITGRGIDKRKRELEERRKAIEEKKKKRRKVVNPDTGTSTEEAGVGSGKTVDAADDFLRGLEADLRGPSDLR